MNQKLSDLANIAEIVAAVAIVASLLFVGFQISQNTQATQIATSSDMGMALMEISQMLAEEDMATLRIRMENEGYDSLSEVEQVRISGMINAYMRVLQGFYYQYQRGGLERVLWDPLERVLLRNFAQDVWVDWWERNRIGYYDEYSDYIDTLIVQSQAD
jgi:hypothetical protein